jgi:hypothetical protein
MDVCEENVLELESIIEKGQPIENFELGKGFNQDG